MATISSTILVIVAFTIQVAFATHNYYLPCDPPQRPDYGRYGPVRDSYRIGSTITFYCDAGYGLYGASYSVCRYGRWAYQPPVCRHIETTTCPVRDAPSYGRVKATGYTPGSTIHYRCKEGFRLVGEAWQRCLRTGYWSGEEPICKRSIVECPDLDDPLNGSVNVTDNTPGSTAHYECDEGFELVGDAYRECQDNGYWSGDIPMCERIIDIVCPDLDDPPYGSVNVTDNSNGSTAHYECDEGFELVGDAYRECLDTGYWSGEEPVCKRIILCPDLDDPRYGSVNVTDNSNGSTAHYECDEGFELVGDAYRECLDTGYWSSEEPVCKRIILCPDLDDPRYGSVNVTDSTPGSTAHYECDKGFKLVGQAYRKCLYNGYWSGQAPVCRRTAIKCPRLPPPRYGKIDVRRYTPTSKAYYSCDDGYELIGSEYRLCRHDGSWHGEAPVCRPKKIVCPNLDTPMYGRVYVKSYTPSSLAYYSCDRGYRRRGSPYRKCQSDGSWYGTAPTCERIKYYHRG